MPIVSDYPIESYGGEAARTGLPLNPAEYPDFRLMYHPRRWNFWPSDDGKTGEWLPNLAQFFLVPGLNCVDAGGGTSLAFAERAEKGWTLLMRSVMDPASYIAQAAGVPYKSGKVPVIYMLKWMLPKVVAGVCALKYDREAHRAWLRELVASGKLPPADSEIIALLTSRVQDEYDRDAGEGGADGKAARRAIIAQAQLAQMAAAADAP